MVGLKEITAGDVGFGSVLNGLFLAFSVMDLAAASWALKAPGRWGFYEGYVAFRQETPIIGHVLLFLLLLLPLALWQLISEDLVGLWKRPAHRRRHIAGTANLVGLIVAISWAIAGVKPAEKTALEVLGAASSDEAARAAAAGGVWQAHLVNVGINLFMATMPFWKHAAAAASINEVLQATPLVAAKKAA